MWLDTEEGRKAFRLLKSGAVRQWSFAYNTIDSRRASDGANELLELDLLEVGPTLVGCNPDTRTLAVKGALLDVPRALAVPALTKAQEAAIERSLGVVQGVAAARHAMNRRAPAITAGHRSGRRGDGATGCCCSSCARYEAVTTSAVTAAAARRPRTARATWRTPSAASRVSRGMTGTRNRAPALAPADTSST